ncbi:MAG: BBP7 family outer membrane beta-barrel protein [Gemmataceae bacterium]
MLTRFLGGVTACLGVAGMLPAQQPSAKFARPQATSYKVRAQAPVPERAPAPAGASPAPTTLPATTPSGPASTVAPTPTGAPTALLTTMPSYANCMDETPTATAPCDVACCTPCGPAGRFWIDAGWVFWQTKGANLPPLITTAPPGTPRQTAGALGQPGTNVFYGGGNNYLNDFRSGFYLNAGMWLDECNRIGIQGNFFFLGEGRDNAALGAPPGSNNIVMRPFTNGQTGQPDTELVAFPNILSGSVSVDARTDVLGGGVSFVKNLCCGPCGRFDALVGYQYFSLTDEVVIRENLTSGPEQLNVTPGTRFLIEDRFRTTNNFHGVQLGFQGERRFGRAFIGYSASVSLGVNQQSFDISGSTTIIPPGQPGQTFPGGLLTQPSNIGHYSQSKFAVMPSVGIRLGYQLTDRLRAYVGYDFVYLSSVARAGDQIDLRVNPSQIPPRANGLVGPAVPAFTPRTTDFWMQGIRVGAEFRF